MNDRIRISDADRERVTARLREHYAEGRLDAEELEERVTAALKAKTYGDLKPIMADLPGPALVQPPGWQAPGGAPAGGEPQAWQPAGWRPGPWAACRGGALAWRGPRLLPLALILLIAAIAIPGASWLFIAFVKVMLVLWLVAFIAGVFGVFRLRRRARRYWQAGAGGRWQDYHRRSGRL